jgi:hypothetical protein
MSAGLPPTAETCADSIDCRTACNEWVVPNYRSIAIFAFGPIRVSQPIAEDYVDEVDVDRDVAFALFPEYGSSRRTRVRFQEFDRQNRRWNEVSYFSSTLARRPAPAIRSSRDAVSSDGNERAVAVL